MNTCVHGIPVKYPCGKCLEAFYAKPAPSVPTTEEVVERVERAIRNQDKLQHVRGEGERQREFEEAVAKHVAKFNGSYMKQVREESFRAGAAWEYWDGEADTLSKKLADAQAQLSTAHEYMHHMEANMITQTLELAKRNAEVARLRGALEKIADIARKAPVTTRA